MKVFLSIICAISVVFLIVLAFLLFLHTGNHSSNSFVERIEKVASKLPSTLSLISVLFCILTLIISSAGLIAQIKTPKFEIYAYTPHMLLYQEESMRRDLCILRDEHGHVSYALGAPTLWKLNVKNAGNQCADNVKIQIRFVDLVFKSQPEAYTLSNLVYGHGFSTLNLTLKTAIQPGEMIELPYIPFRNAMLYEDFCSDHTLMEIKIYENTSLLYHKAMNIEFVEDSLMEDYCCLELSSIEEPIVREMNSHYFNCSDSCISEYLFDSVALCPADFQFTLQEYEQVYKFYLRKVNVYNPLAAQCFSKLATFYGRLYYGKLSLEKGDRDIEGAIQNDINAYALKEREIYYIENQY